jgi:hypothetical protein
MSESPSDPTDASAGPAAPVRKHEAAYPSMVFQHSWQIRLPHVYRIMEAKYVDAFFETGALRLSSFSRFRTNSDEIRADREESDALLTGRHGNLQTVFIDVSPPASAWVLCGTTVFDPSYMGKFGNSCLRIHDPLAFANAIANEIPSFAGGYEGFCLYQSERAVRKELASSAEGGIVGDEKEGYRLQIGPQLANLNSPDRYFIKRMSFNREAEYRWIWLARRQSALVLDIICPEARDSCDRVSL